MLCGAIVMTARRHAPFRPAAAAPAGASTAERRSPSAHRSLNLRLNVRRTDGRWRWRSDL